MPKHHLLNTSLSAFLFKPLFALYPLSESRRECASISDEVEANLEKYRQVKMDEKIHTKVTVLFENEHRLNSPKARLRF